MKHELIVILISVALGACSSKRKTVESPLFNPSAGPETQQELETIAQVPQTEVVEKVSPVTSPPPQPRMAITPNRKAPVSVEIETRQVAAEESEANIIYTALGGEKLAFVAKALLGSTENADLIKTWNQEIQNDVLEKGQQLKIKIENLKPQPIFLSKSVLLQYKAELRSRFIRTEPKNTYTVKTGDTLQMISQRLYSTTRRWTEIYLINYEKIDNPDVLKNGLELRHF